MATWTPPGLGHELLGSWMLRSNLAHLTPRSEHTVGWSPLGGSLVATPDVKLGVSACWTVRFDSAICDDPIESGSCAPPQAKKTKEPTTARERVTKGRI
jgi:hypothetical protein